MVRTGWKALQEDPEQGWGGVGGAVAEKPEASSPRRVSIREPELEWGEAGSWPEKDGRRGRCSRPHS